jgi:EPS-associated MarR family transcriptional regulator
MNEQNRIKNPLEKEEVLYLLSEIYKNPCLTQREISSRVNISLGKTNYLLEALINKGILKIRSFSKQNGKLKKVRYILTRKGFKEKLRLTRYFLKKKEQEYNNIKRQWK